MSKAIVRLNIADVILELKSGFPVRPLTRVERSACFNERLLNFYDTGSRRPDVRVRVEVVRHLPSWPKAETLFLTTHPDDGKENWRLLRTRHGLVFTTPLRGREQSALISPDFRRVTAYVRPHREAGFAWHAHDLVYDFLQVFLIGYLARHGKGVLVHSVGIRNGDSRGLLFIGKSGAGKTTTARLWHGRVRGTVLNDDRVIVRKSRGRYRIYGSPWHGDFSDYLLSPIGSAPLSRMFFISHAKSNRAETLGSSEAFRLLYPALFPVFWSAELLGNILSFSQALVQDVACFRVGLIKHESAIEFAANL